MFKLKLPTAERLEELFLYCKDTGRLINKVDRSTRVKAGSYVSGETQRYRVAYVDGKSYTQHRIIWKMVYGTEPDEIDHINRDGKDNRLCNLREADRSLNCINQRTRKDNKLGRGIHFCNTSGKFVFQMQRNKVRKAWRFDSLEEAITFKEDNLWA